MKNFKFGEKFRSSFRRINTQAWDRCHSVRCSSVVLREGLGTSMIGGDERIRYENYQSLIMNKARVGDGTY